MSDFLNYMANRGIFLVHTLCSVCHRPIIVDVLDCIFGSVRCASCWLGGAP